MERQFTATAYIIQENRVLLVFHKKLKKWLPPGGHLDPNELPPEAAKREAREETGVEIEIIPQENLWINRWNANSFERPFMCLLEEIPEHNGHPAHQHVDFIYLAKPIGGKHEHNMLEVDGMHWFTIEEIEKLKDDVDIFLETKMTLRKILLK